MFLKSIELQGFKSFPDKTLLTFSDGITAVVGPNGSGKSNIADAIRWVLGEQSAKTLRGGKMEDVIFGGTRRRSPMGFCEVSITIDNGDGAIPLEYSEVTVTRRYYRSGESEFFINKRASRLKDVREMFMDTGLGRDGYSMIGQGRIDEILSVKSSERREIFEEAAGISKVRLRKEESCRKLEQAEENLVRIRDIITELEGRVEPLRKQAEKAKRFLILRDELRVLETSAALDSLDGLAEKIKKAKVDYDNAERLLSARKGELEQLYSRGEGFTEKARQLDLSLEEARDGLEERRNSLAAVESDMAVLEANIKNARRSREAYDEENARREARRSELSKSMEENAARRNAIDDRLKEKNADLEALASEIEEAGRQARDAVLRLEGLRASHAMLRDNMQSKLAEAMSLEAAMVQMDERQREGDGRRADAQKRLEEGQRALDGVDSRIGEAAEDADSAKNSLSGVDMMMKVRGDRAEKLKLRVEEAARAVNSGADRLTMLKNMERDYDGFSQAVKKIMQAGKGLGGIQGPLSSLIKVEDKYSVAIETALGSAMQNIVVDDEESAKAAIGYLKANNFGRATFLPVTAVKPRWSGRRALEGERGFCGYGDGLVQCDNTYRDIILSFLGTTAVVDNIDSAIAMGKKYKYSFRIVTLDGQLISAGGAMTGGSATRSTGVLSRANEIERLEVELEKGREELASAKSAHEKAERELAAISYQRRSAEEQLKEAEERIAALNSERSRHEAILESVNESIALLDREKEEYRARREESDRKRVECKAQAEELAKKSDRLKADIDALATETSREAAGELENRLTAVKLEISALNAERSTLLENHSMLEGLLAEADARLLAGKTDAERTAVEIEDMKARSRELKTVAERLQEERRRLSDDVDSLTKQRLALDGEKSKMDREIQNKNGEILNQERERATLENRCLTMEGEEKALLDRLWEAYELTPAAAREIYKKPDDPTAASARITELKGAVKALGSVNLDSVDEFEEVNARYTFMAAQRDDLEKAKRDLTEVIDRLTDNMEESFAKSFREINESFSATFTDIFGGGSAYLKLEDEKNILECGIDISVELPGKGVRAISLLSGGEKAFVATALYFAIIKVSPTPFCVMDEIDAALDDVNVSRFAAYMRRLCSTTQFIVITHRRGTMEGSDILYGATMQEHGVTKLLKLDVREAESKLNIKLT